MQVEQLWEAITDWENDINADLQTKRGRAAGIGALTGAIAGYGWPTAPVFEEAGETELHSYVDGVKQVSGYPG